MTTHYFWDPDEDNVIKEYDDEGDTIATYTTEPELYGNVMAQERGGETREYHFDGLGSTTELTDDSGTVADTRQYSAFGEVTARSGTTEFPFQYVGEKGYYTDEETGDISVRRRPYQPLTARWVTVDPIGVQDGLNRYRYGRNNPIGNIDENGEITVTITGMDDARACGLASVSFRFNIVNAYPKQFEGYIVQMNETWLVSKACPEAWNNVFPNPGQQPAKRFWEAWPIGIDNKTGKPVRSVKDDVRNPGSRITRPPSGGLFTFGHYEVLGTIKLYLKDTTGMIEEDAKWGKGKVPESGTLYSTLDRPLWWSNAPLEGTARRLVGITWCCCGEKREMTVVAYGNPPPQPPG